MTWPSTKGNEDMALQSASPSGPISDEKGDCAVRDWQEGPAALPL